MGLCILIVQHCHVLNHRTLMNHFSFGREVGEKRSVSLLFGVVPTPHKACDYTHTHQPKLSQDCSQLSAPPSCAPHFSVCRPPSSSPLPRLRVCCMAVIFHGGELVEAVNTLHLSLWTQNDPATPLSLMLLPRSLVPRSL